MTDTRTDLSKKLDNLIEQLREKEKELNTVLNAYIEAQHDVYRQEHSAPKAEKVSISDDLLKRLSLFKEKVESEDTKKLQLEIKGLQDQISKLRKKLNDNHKSDSPSTLTNKTSLL